MHQKNDRIFRFFELMKPPMEGVFLPMSKSLYTRKLICDFLYGDALEALPSEMPEDVRVVHRCLTLVSQAGGHNRESDEPQRIDVRDCGAAYRFLMAVLAVTPGQWLLTGTERLLQRPIEELLQALRSIGAEIQWCSCRDAIDRVSDGDGVNPCIDVRPCVSLDNLEFLDRDSRPCVSANEYCGCWQIHGKPLHAEELTIDCTRTGQFASSLLLISRKIGLKKLHILPENPSSASYIEMTKAVVSGSVKLEEHRLADWSAAVYWYAYLLLSQIHKCGLHASEASAVSTNGDIPNQGDMPLSADFPASYKLMHLDLDSIQSDAVIARWFAEWGVKSRQVEDGVVIETDGNFGVRKDTMVFGEKNDCQDGRSRYDKKSESQDRDIELDMSQNLDLVPVLACMACLWPKKMVFYGVANLKYKESNRLQIIQEQLSHFAQIDIKSYNGIPDNQLVIDPVFCEDVPCHVSTNDVIFHRDAMNCVSANDNRSNIPPRIFSFDAHNDHRFVMGFSLFALKGTVRINGFESVKKSYPDFNAEGVIAGTDIVG